MKFKDIMIWLMIFIVGGLIINFLIYPESFDSFKEKVNEILNLFSSSDNVVKVSSMQPCLGGEFNRVTCKAACSIEGLNYRTFKCVEGTAICHCKK